MKSRFDELAEDIPTDNSKMPWYPNCKGCVFAEDDGIGTGYKKGNCMIYELPGGKPYKLARGGTCEYYEED